MESAFARRVAEVSVYADDGQPAQIEEIGEIAVKSPAAIRRYDGGEELNGGVPLKFGRAACNGHANLFRL
jgi:hypothetical protein